MLKAAASAPVILTLMAGSARAGYISTGQYVEGSVNSDCAVPPPEPPRYNPEDCPHVPP